MRKLASLSLVAIALAACSQQDGERTYGEPDIAPSAAPGVAWRFQHDYSLDDDRIAAVQEAHASACERLGVAKCRITGLKYDIDSRNRVSGMLRVKLDPVIARQFANQAKVTVEKNDGTLVSSQFSGDDVGTEIASAQRDRSQLQANIAAVEKRLAASSGDRERAQLQNELDQLRRQVNESQAEVAAGRERLASTPMTFNYYGGGGIAGFDENPIKASWRIMIESAVTMVSLVLKVVGALLPWALLILLLIAAARSRPARAMREWWRRIAPKPEREEL